MGDELNLAGIRDKCGGWDEEEKECTPGFPEDCPFSADCKDDFDKQEKKENEEAESDPD